MTTKNLKLNKTDFLKALKNLDKYGIRYNDYGYDGGPQCAVGHLCTAKGVDPKEKGILVARENGFEHSDITRFNDGGYGEKGYQSYATKEELATFFAFGAAGAFKSLKLTKVE